MGKIIKTTLKKLTAVLMAVLIMTGCSSAESQKSADLTDCTLMYVTWVGIAPWFIAEEKGFFEQNGLNVNMELNDDETTYSSLLQNNEVNATGFVLDSFVTTNAGGIDIVCPMALDASVGGDGIIASAEINSVEDLKGKTVALDKTSTPYYFFCRVLSDYGMTEEDVTIADMTSGDAGTAFLGGSVDAAVVWEPWLTNASQREGGHVLVSTVDYPTSIVDGLAVTRTFYEENPEGVRGLMQSWYDAVDYYNENIDEGNQIMADGLGLSLEEFESMVNTVRYFGKDDNETFFDENADVNIYDTVEFISDFWKSTEHISQDYDYMNAIVTID